MAAKLLHSLADDNPDLHKQIGCMNGILQIFDRPNIGRRHKGILPSGNSHFNIASLDADLSKANDQGAIVETIGEKDTNVKQVPTKPSSLPPLDCGNVRDPSLTQPLASPKLGRLSLDLRDIVKDSMHRESRAQVSKHKGDSPRPLRLSKSFNDRNTNDLPGDLKESLKLLATLKEAPLYEMKDSQKIKDLPRLSLDSRESSMRASTCDLNLSYLPTSFEEEDDWFNERGKASCTNRVSRPPSVVAKLMGLETLPESKPSQETQFRSTKVAFLDSREDNLVQKNWCSRKEPTSPRWKCPNEPAPWKYLEGSHSPQNPLLLKQLKSPERVPNRSPSVYREVEKRLKDLEFEQSGKDLRALKQILEAMEAKGLLGTVKQEQKASRVSRRISGSIIASESQKKRTVVSTMNTRTEDNQNAVHSRRRSNESCRDNTSSASSTNRLNSNRNLRVGQNQNSAKAQPASKDSNVSSFKRLGSTSPRLQKKLEFDKRSIPPTPDSARSRRRSNQKLSESSGGSPGGRRRVKPSNDLETTGNVRSVKTSQLQIPTNEAFKCSDIREIRTNANRRLNEGQMLDELPSVGLEHPSPISVLDVSEYSEDSPSPVKHTSHSPEGMMICNMNSHGTGIEARISEIGRLEGEWDSEDSPCVTHDLVSGFTSEIKIKKSGNTDSLAAKNLNPVHTYVLEILSASGILHTDLNSTFNLNISGHLINPELFFVLEQTKPSNGYLMKLDRKLTFDAVNEILALKLAFARPPAEPWLSSSKLAKKTLNAEKLIREMCEEIEQLRTNEKREPLSDEWANDSNVSGVVLDVERSIFRDLVDEVVIGEMAKRLF